jgi:hypothetical protein
MPLLIMAMSTMPLLIMAMSRASLLTVALLVEVITRLTILAPPQCF